MDKTEFFYWCIWWGWWVVQFVLYTLLGVEFSSGFGRNIFAPEPASAPVIFSSGDYVSGGTLVEPAKRAAVDLADGRGRDYLPFAGLSSECARELALSDKILEYGLRFPSGAK